MTHPHIRLYTDGGARGNPGPAGIGAALYVVSEEGEEKLVGEVSEYIGETTNNQAEYRALIAALQLASKLGAKKVDVRMDSELIVKQMTGEYRVKNADLAARYLEVANLRTRFQSVTFRHVRREKNTAADALVNRAIDLKGKS